MDRSLQKVGLTLNIAARAMGDLPPAARSRYPYRSWLSRKPHAHGVHILDMTVGSLTERASVLERIVPAGTATAPRTAGGAR